MNITQSEKSKDSENRNSLQMQKKEIQDLTEFWESKIRQIHKRIQENEVRLETMESHTDYEYKDLLREINEAEKDHKKDLKLLLDLLGKYNIATR